MIRMTIKEDKQISALLKDYPVVAARAAEIALDRTTRDAKEEIYVEMRRVFKSPTDYTLDSLKMRPTQNHNMETSIWFKDPVRMSQHYLVPQVEGGARRLKGFEQALDDTMFVPGRGVRLNKAGNISMGQIRQILSVFGLAERTAGYSANITSRSRRKNPNQRDYFFLKKRHGRLYPGVYERVAKRRAGLGKARKHVIDKSLAYQKGMRRGKFSSVIRARGIKPILIKGRQFAPYKPRLAFYEIAEKVYEQSFKRRFFAEFERRLS